MNTGMITSSSFLSLELDDDSGEEASFTVVGVFVPVDVSPKHEEPCFFLFTRVAKNVRVSKCKLNGDKQLISVTGSIQRYKEMI